jgi:type II secretory pathway pseudopilin PulG
MRSLGTNAGPRRPRASGFSLLEMIIVVAITIVVSVISVVSLVPLLQSQHLTNAYNTTLSAMRQARDNAVSQRTSYSVTFGGTVNSGGIITSSTITVAPTVTSFGTDSSGASLGGDQNTVVYQLPSDVAFSALSGLASVPPPDGYGSSANSVDFGYTSNGNAGGTTKTVLYFCPDGSAQTASGCLGAGNWDGGVVYLNGPVVYSGGMPSGYMPNSRAISLWGATGRIHGWRLYPSGATYQWVRQ